MPTPLRKLAVTMDYSSLDGSIPESPKAKPADFDGVFTRHKTGRVLFLENKQPGEFESMSRGQTITLDDVLQLNPEKITVLVIEHSGVQTDIGAFLFDPQRVMNWKTKKWINCDLECFRKKLNEWWINQNEERN